MRSEHGVEVRLIRETTWQDVLDESAVDLTGQTILVTGGTTGLGKETAKALRTAGAHVLITARTPERAEGEEHVVLDLADLDRRGTHAVAVHPGMSTTELGRYMTRDDVTELMGRVKAAPGGGPKYKSIEQGAATTVDAVAHPELPGGAYLEDAAVSEDDAEWTKDERSWARLWDLTEELLSRSR